jgi:hypothetical protein
MLIYHRIRTVLLASTYANYISVVAGVHVEIYRQGNKI